MGSKLRNSNGKYACSICYMPVESSAAFCDSCGKVLDGEVPGKNCTSCETLIMADAPGCPICGEKFPEAMMQKPLNNEDEALISQLMTWTKARSPAVQEDTVEDKKEREHALHVLKSLTVGESEEAAQKRIEKLEEGGREKGVVESREKQLVKVGKPFEGTLEQNMASINQTETLLKKKKALLKTIEGKIDSQSLELRRKTLIEIGELEEKKTALISYQSDILMMSGAYRRLLKEQQDELVKIEAELKKRVEAFRKELERRNKQNERLRKREEALDKREEDLSHRFLDLKKRSNEVLKREEILTRGYEELQLKEEALVKWEEEITASRAAHESGGTETEGLPGASKEEWLKEHQALQEDLRKVRIDPVDQDKRDPHNKMANELKRLNESLEEKEGELIARSKEVEVLRSLLEQKEKEIQDLRSAPADASIDEDTKRLLKILDGLLENLPEEIVDKFAKSDDYALYEKVLDMYKI